MRPVVAVLLALLVPLLSSASAAPRSFQIDDGITFPTGASQTSAPISLFAPDVRGLNVLILRAPHVTIEVQALDSVTVQGAARTTQVTTDRRIATYSLHDVSVRLEKAPRAGWLGVHSERGSASWVASSPLEVHAYVASSMGNPQPGAATEDTSPVFVSTVDSPHLLWSSAGAWRYQGAGTLRFEGVNVLIQAAENETRLQTGQWATGSTTGGSRQVWASLQFEAGALELVDQGSLSLATSAARVDWPGAARLTSATPTPPLLADARSAALLPVGDEAIDVAVEAAPTAITKGQAALPLAGPALGWPLVVGSALCVAGGAAWMIQRRRARAVPKLEADECLELAEAAAEGGNFVLAAHWAQRARETAPHVAQLWFDEGYFLLEAGESDAALAAFVGAARRGASGFPLYHAARAAARAGRTTEAAKQLTEALRHAPELRGDAARDSDLSPLLAPHD